MSPVRRRGRTRLMFCTAGLRGDVRSVRTHVSVRKSGLDGSVSIREPKTRSTGESTARAGIRYHRDLSSGRLVRRAVPIPIQRVEPDSGWPITTTGSLFSFSFQTLMK